MQIRNCACLLICRQGVEKALSTQHIIVYVSIVRQQSVEYAQYVDLEHHRRMQRMQKEEAWSELNVHD